jgi:hypothetical protein
MAASVQDMGIDHGRADILMPKEFLDGTDVIACFKQMRGKGMSESVTTDMLNDACTGDCFLDAPLNNRLMSVMPRAKGFAQSIHQLGRSNSIHRRIYHSLPGIELSNNCLPPIG